MVFRTVMALAGFAAGLLLFEAVLRSFPAYDFQKMIHVNNIIRAGDLSGKYRPSKIFGYELIPHASPAVNSWGMRDKEYARTASSGTFRILLLGDSITESGTWSDIVEEKLNDTGSYEILNAGVMGWGLNQYWMYMKTKGGQFSPDAVLIGLCLNDVGEYETIQTILDDPAHNRLMFYYVNAVDKHNDYLTLQANAALFRYSALYRFFVIHSFGRKSSAIEDKEYSPLEQLKEISRLAHGRVYAVIFPYLKPLENYDEHEAYEYAHTRELLADAGIPYLDITPHFSRYGKDIVLFRKSPDDKIHFNDEANRIKADIIYPWLLKNINHRPPGPFPEAG